MKSSEDATSKVRQELSRIGWLGREWVKGTATDLKWRAGKRVAAASANEAGLAGIDHLVVVMLENRSFDHMLGYLKREGILPEVNGLSPDMANAHNGQSYKVRHIDHLAMGDNDPGHGGSSVDDQLKDGNQGFVRNFAHHCPNADPGLIMGYFNADELPAYDHLARNFVVCDRWFSSTPGATWPNRLYAAAGRANGTREDQQLPIYYLPSFMRYLDRADPPAPWRWYSNDPGLLRAIDPRYRLSRHHHFAYLDRSAVTGIDKEIEGLLVHTKPSFLDDAATGDLPAVSWIDPNFKDLRSLGPLSNDDHPPTDVRAGQSLVWMIYRALAQSPAWEKTMLLITYDEHGGFFDHVSPPEAPDDDPAFRRYGVRVPALVISPWVGQGQVAHTVFDHTSIIKTALLRFCRDAAGTIPDLGTRVTKANDLSVLLDGSTARTPPAGDATTEIIADWQAKRAADRAHTPVPAAPEAEVVHDFAAGVLAMGRKLRDVGLPAGRP